MAPRNSRRRVVGDFMTPNGTRRVDPFRTAVPFWGTNYLEFEWFAAKTGPAAVCPQKGLCGVQQKMGSLHVTRVISLATDDAGVLAWHIPTGLTS